MSDSLPSQQELYFHMPGVAGGRPVRCITVSGLDRFEAQVYGMRLGSVVDSSRDVVAACKYVAKHRNPDAGWLRDNARRLAEYGIATEESELARAYGDFRRELLGTGVLSEMLDWTPEKRIPGYALLKNKTALLYRGWRHNGELILDGFAPVPVRWANDVYDISGSPSSGTGSIFSGKEIAVRSSEGLEAVGWRIVKAFPLGWEFQNETHNPFEPMKNCCLLIAKN